MEMKEGVNAFCRWRKVGFLFLLLAWRERKFYTHTHTRIFFRTLPYIQRCFWNQLKVIKAMLCVCLWIRSKKRQGSKLWAVALMGFSPLFNMLIITTSTSIYKCIHVTFLTQFLKKKTNHIYLLLLWNWFNVLGLVIANQQVYCTYIICTIRVNKFH